jgi:GR25 family glycosyltransferase involved in LPS biosynthesis
MVSAYLINLQKEVERRVFSQEFWPFPNIPMKVVSGVDQNEITAKYVTQGVAAIWASHLRAMETFLTTGEEFGIILEDDYQIIDVSKFSKVLDLARTVDADFVQLGFLITGIDIFLEKHLRNIQNYVFRIGISAPFVGTRIATRMRVREASDTPPLLVSYQVLPGAHAYVISQKLARAITENQNEQFLAADDFFMSLAPMRTFRMYRAKNSCVSQREIPSTIGDRFKKL